MTTITALDLGRAAYADRNWRDAFDQLTAADQQGGLPAQDIEQLALVAVMIGRSADCIDLLTRAHEEFLSIGDIPGAARCAGWIGMHLMQTGQDARMAGWFARCQRLVQESAEPCPIEGLLLVPVALGSLYAGDVETALRTFDEVAMLGERFRDPDVCALARLGQGQSRIGLGQTSEGLADLDEAMVAVTAGEVSPIPSGIIYCAVIEGCYLSFDLRRAQQWTAVKEPDGATEYFDTIVIGGGQAGLAVGYYLARQNREFIILDEHEQVGDAWRNRWDSLRLFTPAKYNGLPGMKFPGDRLAFPTKDEQADYLELYAAQHALPVRTGMRVDRLRREGDGFMLTSGACCFAADHVVVATGPCHIPRIPEFASRLSTSIVQLHSYDYRGPSQLQDGDVLVVGVGNSGAEIALELSRSHRTFLAGKETAEIPFRHGRAAARFGLPVVRFIGMHVLTLNTPVGRKVGPGFVVHAAPLIRTKRKNLAEAGVESVGRITGVRDGLPMVEGDEAVDVSNVVWCTGFRDEFPWVDLQVFDENRRPICYRGVVETAPGLYFLGQEFQFAATSATLPGVGRDAEYIATDIAAKARNDRRTTRVDGLRSA